MDENEILISSVSSSSSPRAKYTKIQHFNSIELANKFIAEYLPKTAIRSSRTVNCTICPTENTAQKCNNSHKMKWSSHYCKDPLCHEAGQSKLCPAKYKSEQCLLTNICELSQSSEQHLSEEIQNRVKVLIKIDDEGEKVVPLKTSNEEKTHKEKKPATEVKKKRKSKNKEPVTAAPTTPVDAKKSFVDLFSKKERKSEPGGGVSVESLSINTPVKDELKSTPILRTDNPEVAAAPRKSAFDFLMGKKKQLALSENSKNSDSESCVVLDTSNSPLSCEASPRPVKPSPSSFFQLNSEARTSSKVASRPETTSNNSNNNNNKPVVEAFVNEPYFLSHQVQYSAEDSEFLELLDKSVYKGPIPMKTTSSLIAAQAFVDGIDLKYGLNLDFKCEVPPTHNDKNFCDCHKKLSDLDTYSAELDSKMSIGSQQTSSLSQGIESPLEPVQKRRRTDKTLTSPETKIPLNKPEETEMWTEKYQFKSENDIVTNNSQLERLKEWLKNWKRLLAKPDAVVPGRKPGKKGKKYADSESEYYDSDFSNSESSSTRKFYSNGLLLSGPHGCGKTSSVYAIAKLLGFKVFEVNASSPRNKNAIIAELEGAINSHHVNGTVKQQEASGNESNVMSKFFGKPVGEVGGGGGEENRLPNIVVKNKSKKRKNSLRRETIHNLTNKINFNFANKSKVVSDDDDDDDDGDESDLDADDDFFKKNKNHKVTLPGKKSGGKAAVEASKESSFISGSGGDAGSSSLNIQRESLILFDEIDVIFKEDYGFWSAILHFIKRSKKPIVLTTSDEFLQDKMNLNIEKIEFFRPRIDASVRYLKKIAKLQNSLIDTPTAYEIIQQTNCDMRRALIQLQLELVTEPTKIPVQRNTTLQLAKYLSSLLDCRHTSDFPNPIHFLDFLAKKIEQNNNRNTHDKFRRYDSVVFKDGLSDTTEGPTFNPFMPNTPTNIDEDSLINLDEDMVSFKNQNTTEIFTAYTKIFNHIMSVSDWSKHGTVNSFSFTSNTAINKLAQYANKFTSNQSLFLEYRPFLQLICRAEEFKQKTSTKRRFTHYLTHLNIGIGKEDYSLLAKSSLACDVPEQQVVEKADGRVCKKNYVEDDLFSDGN